MDCVDAGSGVFGKTVGGPCGDAERVDPTVTARAASDLLAGSDLVGEGDDVQARDNTIATRTKPIPECMNQF